MKMIKLTSKIAINLENVYCINCLDDKQVFNMSYVKTNMSEEDNHKDMSGYFYADANFDAYKHSNYFKKNFIEVIGANRKLLINISKLAYVKKDYVNSPKIVFCFNHSIPSSSKLWNPEFMYMEVYHHQLNSVFDTIIEEINKKVD